MCNQYRGEPEQGQTFYMHCNNTNSIGRYVYMYMDYTNYMHACEFEVFGEPKIAPALEQVYITCELFVIYF